MTPIIECLKNKEFQRSNAASQALREIKVRMTKAPVLRYHDFTKVFEVAYDASGVGWWCLESRRSPYSFL